MSSNGFPFLVAAILMGASGALGRCVETTAYAEEAKTAYEYYVDSETNKAYSPLYESGPVRYVVQFPGHNPYDAFLYGDDFVAFLSIASKESYAIRNLWFSLKSDGKELIAPRNSGVSDKEKWKAYTAIREQATPARGLHLDLAEGALMGFIYKPAQLKGVSKVDLDVKFDLIVGEARSTIKKHFVLRRTTLSERTRDDPRFRERPPGDAVLVGAWWLDTRGNNLSAEYEAIVAKVAKGEESAVRLTGHGFLPRVRYDEIHFEGFFMHVDRAR